MAITRAGKNLSDLPSLQYKENNGKFAAFNGRLKAKSFSASGGLRPPDLLTRGSAPGPRWGQSPQIPIIGWRYRARHSSATSQMLLSLSPSGQPHIGTVYQLMHRAHVHGLLIDRIQRGPYFLVVFITPCRPRCK